MVLTYHPRGGEPFKFFPPRSTEQWDELAAKIDPITLALITFTPPEECNGHEVLRVSNWSRNKLRELYHQIGRDCFCDASRSVASMIFNGRELRSPLGLLVHRGRQLFNSQNLKEENHDTSSAV